MWCSIVIIEKSLHGKTPRHNRGGVGYEILRVNLLRAQVRSYDSLEIRLIMFSLP